MKFQKTSGPSAGRHDEWFVGSDDEIRRAELPARSEDGRRRRVRGRAFRSARPHPLFDGFDLRVREPALARQNRRSPASGSQGGM